ncbi:DNA polymerase alpha subunit B [Hondaea fermentalgiana]|uniref:DNA polymerase alpha subunit B n=1 Tax=Hondaea fermentalgiana TaxID=2315210 RepID=A0A2R5GSZ2_9STRA|nr:DNA polymerase alpha subunit B [Hondaea fermentalgiana]|eukprot:GBG31501.1 DNA polymerase alpha subunit B [Hondaea fermentalgiana]
MAATAGGLEADVQRAFKHVSDVDLDADFVRSCEGLCKQYNVTAEDLATKWEVMALNNSGLESKRLMKKLDESLAKEKQRIDAKRGRKVYGKSQPRQEFDVKGGRVQAAGFASSPMMTKRTVSRMAGQSRRIDDFSQKFGLDLTPVTSSASGTPSKDSLLSAQKRKKAKLERPQTPTKTRDSDTASLPTSSSPICSTNGYAERTDMGKVELCLDAGKTELAWEDVCAKRAEAAIARGPASVEVKSDLREPYPYMYTTILERAAILEEQLLEMKERFKAEHGWSDDDFSPVGHTGQDEILVLGRICCEAPNGKLNANSLVLEGSRAEANGMRIKLEMDSKIAAFSFFPGQIVAVRGVCPSGDTLHAREIYASVKPSFVTISRSRAVKRETGQSAPLTIMSAAGPFSTQGDLEYEPLEDLLANVDEAKPDLLVLMGPFVDARHPQVAAGKCTKTLEGGESLRLTFEDVMAFVLQRIATAVDGMATRVVIVPSLDDVTHDVAYPQPPLPRSLLADVELADRKQMVFAPNPCLLSVDGICVGVNTQDTILHLAQEDAAKVDRSAPKKSRIQRLAEHMLHQASFYPMFPPAPGASLELSQRSAITLKYQPDLLLVTSKLMHFAHDLEGTMCVNPGRLTRGRTGGMYARIIVKPRSKDEIEAAVAPGISKAKQDQGEGAHLTSNAGDAADPLIPNNLPSRTKVEVVRI